MQPPLNCGLMGRMKRIPIIIVKTGEAVPAARSLGGDFEDWFVAGLGPDRVEARVVRVDRGETLPDVPALSPDAAVLVTGSPAMVSHRLDWSERSAAWLAEAHRAGHPMLGVCYGHQLLAHALGGRVGPNPAGRRLGRAELVEVELDDALLGRFTPGTAFHVSHVEAVLEPPPGARVVARAAHDPHHALHFGGRSWGVQFHPEFDRAVMRAYIESRADALRAEGQDPDALIADVASESRPKPPGAELLRRFIDLASTQAGAQTLPEQTCGA